MRRAGQAAAVCAAALVLLFWFVLEEGGHREKTNNRAAWRRCAQWPSDLPPDPDLVIFEESSDKCTRRDARWTLQRERGKAELCVVQALASGNLRVIIEYDDRIAALRDPATQAVHREIGGVLVWAPAEPVHSPEALGPTVLLCQKHGDALLDGDVAARCAIPAVVESPPKVYFANCTAQPLAVRDWAPPLGQNSVQADKVLFVGDSTMYQFAYYMNATRDCWRIREPVSFSFSRARGLEDNLDMYIASLTDAVSAGVDAVVLNCGLWDAMSGARGSFERLWPTLARAIEIAQRAGVRIVWRTTVAVHPSRTSLLTKFTSARVDEINRFTMAHMPRGVEIVDANAITRLIPEHTAPNDYRHYCQEPYQLLAVALIRVLGLT